MLYVLQYQISCPYLIIRISSSTSSMWTFIFVLNKCIVNDYFCVFMCIPVGLCTCTYVCTSEYTLGIISKVLYILIFKPVLENHQDGQTGQPASLRDPPFLVSPGGITSMCYNPWPFHMGSWDQTLVLMLRWKTPYQTRCLPILELLFMFFFGDLLLVSV